MTSYIHQTIFSSTLCPINIFRLYADSKQPDIQWHFLPSAIYEHGQKPGPCHAYQVCNNYLVYIDYNVVIIIHIPESNKIEALVSLR